MAHTAFERGDFARAEQAYTEVIGLIPDNDPARKDLTERVAASIYKQAEQARDKGDLAGIMSDYTPDSRLFTPDGQQTRRVKTGSSYLSQSELVLTFGIGRREAAERLVVEWPSGRTDEFKSLAAGRYDVVEGKSPAPSQ